MFALYEGSRTSVDQAFGPGGTRTTRVTDNRIMGGIRLYLNENTLQWNDRNGTTLDIIAPFSAPSFIFPSTGTNLSIAPRSNGTGRRKAGPFFGGSRGTCSGALWPHRHSGGAMSGAARLC